MAVIVCVVPNADNIYERASRWAETRSGVVWLVALALIPTLLWLIAFGITGEGANRGFYGTTAQVIPTLLLVAAFEGRGFRLQNRPAGMAAFTVLQLLTAVGGLVACLYVVGGASPGPFTLALTASALSNTLTQVVMLALLNTD